MKKIIAGLLAVFLVAVTAGCDFIPTDRPPVDPLDAEHEGIYVLETKTVENIEVTAQYVYSIIELKKDGKVETRTLDMYGLDAASGNYKINGDTITITIGLRTQNYDYDEDEETLSYEGRISRKDTKMTYKKSSSFSAPTTKGGVNFKDELFGDPIDQNFYNYCPTIFMEGNDIMHIYYCSNKIDGNITDYIAYRKGILQGDGTWKFSEKSLVLEPTPREPGDPQVWDSRHDCDPSVIKGEFKYKDENYNYLMAFLGCYSNDSSSNEVGIAVAKNPEGPWIKIVEMNPIADYYNSPEYSKGAWGYGQPCLVSVDKKGKVLLFYTKGISSGTYAYVEYWDLADLDNPNKIHEEKVSNSGVVNASGGVDVINNGDFAYDPVNNRLFVIKEDFPYPSDNGSGDAVTGGNTTLYLDLNIDDEYVGETLFAGGIMKWNAVGSISKNETTFDRVHNAGIITDEYGWLINPFQIPVVYTRSDLAMRHPNWSKPGHWQALHTYRLYGYLLEI